MTYLRNNTSAKAGVRRLDEPAPTLYFGERVNTAAFVEHPSDKPKAGVQLTVEVASALQTFPADYPWRGTRSEAFRQLGDAMPPAFAAHVVLAAMRPEVTQ